MVVCLVCLFRDLVSLCVCVVILGVDVILVITTWSSLACWYCVAGVALLWCGCLIAWIALALLYCLR